MIKLTLTDSDNAFVWVNPHSVCYCIQMNNNTQLVFAGDNFISVKENVSYVITEIERAKKRTNDKNIPC